MRARSHASRDPACENVIDKNKLKLRMPLKAALNGNTVGRNVSSESHRCCFIHVRYCFYRHERGKNGGLWKHVPRFQKATGTHTHTHTTPPPQSVA